MCETHYGQLLNLNYTPPNCLTIALQLYEEAFLTHTHTPQIGPVQYSKI